MSKPLFQTGIIKQMSNKYDIDEDLISEAVYHQFKFVTKVMKRGKFESVRVRKFGKFHVNPKRIEYLNDAKRRKEQHSSTAKRE